jgi:hypothetical protein
MGKWEDRFEQHRVHEALKKLHDSIMRYRGNVAEGEEQIDHIVNCVRYVTRRLKTVDPQLVSVPHLDEIAHLADSALASLDAYSKSKDDSNWNAADLAAEGIVQACLKLPPIRAAKEVEGVQESVVRFRRSAGQYLRKLEDKATEVRKSLDALAEKVGKHEADVAAQVTRLDTAIQTFISESTQSEAGRSAQFTEAEASRKSAFDEAEKARNAELSAQITATAEQLAAHVSASTEAFEQLRESADSEFSVLLERQRTEAEAIMADLATLKESAKESVGIIAATGMAGGYERTANEEKAAADRWRRIAAAAFVGVIGFALLSVFWPLLVEGGADWEGVAAKIYASLTFALLAAYAGREAEKHRRSERYHRQRSLELRSLNPYLEPLSAEQQSAIRSVVADRIFGRDDLNATAPAEAPPPLPNVIDALSTILARK